MRTELFSKVEINGCRLVRAVSVEQYLVYLSAFKRIEEQELKKARLGISGRILLQKVSEECSGGYKGT